MGEAEHIVFTHDEVAFRMRDGVLEESITMRDRFEALLAKGCETLDPVDRAYCFYCGNYVEYPSSGAFLAHRSDCPYVAAKSFLKRGCVP